MKRIHQKDINTPEYYDTRIWAQEVNERPYYDATRMRELLKPAKNGDRIVDLGAGCFGAAQYAAEKANLAAHIVAVDYSKVAAELVTAAVQKGPRKYLSFEYILSDVRETPLPDASFDLVTSGEVIEHMEEPEKLVAEMARLCKPGGWMTLSTVNDFCPNALKHEYPEHLWSFQPADLVGYFKPYGEPRYYIFGDYHMIECRRA